jgi:hypothetical protein
MSERLPLLGSDEHKAWCINADKDLRGEPAPSKNRDPRQPITEQRTRAGYSDKVKQRTLNLIVVQKKGPKEAVGMIFREMGVYVTESAAKNWLCIYRRKLKEDKAHASKQAH